MLAPAPRDPMGPMGPMLSPILDRDFVDRSTLMILIGHRGHRGHRVRNAHAKARAVTSWRCRSRRAPSLIALAAMAKILENNVFS
jgi:hypothetical protein